MKPQYKPLSSSPPPAYVPTFWERLLVCLFRLTRRRK